jgi:hypothetical protein
MSTPAELYANGIKKKFANYFAAWLPGEKLRLGDVGVINNNLFTRITSLDHLGVNFSERSDESSTPIDYVSESGVSVFFKTSGEINPSLPNVPEASAGVGVEFSCKGAFIIKAPSSHEPSIEDLAQLEKDLIRLYAKEQWQFEWVVITRLIQTPSASIIISNSSNSKVEFSVDGNIPLANLDLGNVNLNFGLKSQTGDVVKFIGAQNLTPLFKVAKIKSKWFGLGKPHLDSTSIGITDDPIVGMSPDRARTEADITATLYLDIVRDIKDN